MDRVQNGACGVALVNGISLQNKLAVKGGEYLLLVTPGRLTTDVKEKNKAADVNIMLKTFTTTHQGPIVCA